MVLIDLTQTFTDQMPVYPGDPVPTLTAAATLERDGYRDFVLTSRMHIGTHVDAPAHMIPGGKGLLAYPLETLVGRAVVVEAPGQGELGAELLAGQMLQSGDIVLFHTGWSTHFGEPEYYLEYPVLTEPLARELVARGIKMVGIDSPSPDRPPFPVHKLLLGNDILIIENLTNLTALLGAGECELFALPLKIASDSAWARVVARV